MKHANRPLAMIAAINAMAALAFGNSRPIRSRDRYLDAKAPPEITKAVIDAAVAKRARKNAKRARR